MNLNRRLSATMPPESVEVFLGDRLELAREFRSLTQKQLGEQVAASHVVISQCENGKKKEVAVDLLEAFCLTLGFERAFFFENVVEIFHESECNFRHRRSASGKLKSQIRAHATLIGMVVDQLKTEFGFPGYNVPAVRATGRREMDAAAELCRRTWGLGVDNPIIHIGRVLENAGVIVVPHVVQSTKVDAFSRRGITTLIFLNQLIPSPSRWVWDIAHECGHLVLHEGIVTGTPDTEAQANWFAGAFLLPQRAFAREFRSAAFSWPHIFALKRRWGVSAAAIVRRAYDLDLISAVWYRRAFQYMSAEGWTRGEPHEPEFDAPELIGSALRGLGTDVPLTAEQLAQRLGFSMSTFQEVTGFRVRPTKTATRSALPFSKATEQ